MNVSRAGEIVCLEFGGSHVRPGSHAESRGTRNAVIYTYTFLHFSAPSRLRVNRSKKRQPAAAHEKNCIVR